MTPIHKINSDIFKVLFERCLHPWREVKYSRSSHFCLLWPRQAQLSICKVIASRSQQFKQKILLDLRHFSYDDRFQELSLFNLEKRRMRDDLINKYKYLKNICQEYDIRFFSVVPNDRMRNNGQKVKHKKFHPNMRKNWFTLRVTEHWSRLLGEVMESLFLEMHKTNLDTSLCNLLKMTLPWCGCWTRLPLELLSNPNWSMILWFCVKYPFTEVDCKSDCGTPCSNLTAHHNKCSASCSYFFWMENLYLTPWH